MNSTLSTSVQEINDTGAPRHDETTDDVNRIEGGGSKEKAKKIQKPLTPGERRSLGAVAKKFRQSWGATSKDDIKARHARGQDVLNAVSRFGAEAVGAFAAEINRSESYVYAYAAVAKTWSAGALRQLLARSEGRIEWSHLVLLSNKKRLEGEPRKELLEKIISVGMTPTELKNLLYPKATSENLDPNHTEDGVVDDEHASSSNDEAAQAEADLAAPEGADGGESGELKVVVQVEAVEATARDVKVIVTHDGAQRRHGEVEASIVTGSGDIDESSPLAMCVQQLRQFTGVFTSLAGQAEMIDQLVLSSFEEADEDELTADVLAELESAKAANGGLEERCRNNGERLDAVITSVRLVIAKRAGTVPGKDDGTSLRMLPSGTVATMQQADSPALITQE